MWVNMTAITEVYGRFTNRTILVGGLEHDFYDFPIYIGNSIISTDELIFFRGVGIPPTRDKSGDYDDFGSCKSGLSWR